MDIMTIKHKFSVNPVFLAVKHANFFLKITVYYVKKRCIEFMTKPKRNVLVKTDTMTKF